VTERRVACGKEDNKTFSLKPQVAEGAPASKDGEEKVLLNKRGSVGQECKNSITTPQKTCRGKSRKSKENKAFLTRLQTTGQGGRGERYDRREGVKREEAEEEKA